MKFFIIATAIFVAALAADDHKEIHRKCQDDPASHIDNMVSDPSRIENLPANYGKHILCMCKGLHLLTEDGKANRQEIQSRVEHAMPQDATKVAAVVAECSENRANGEDTAMHIWACLHKHQVMQGHGHSSEESSEKDSSEHHHHHH
ncbi:unnamed protein product [Ceutorhynchus assimilis]|uniref:Uncharacterized protein n=1 Tax=Ceutorhynchus assimilis TaxID=467358 RepID=A0A9N9MPK6_9CUCU|nr:unnamed protein product [Ceutorhynchus assimilis]